MKVYGKCKSCKTENGYSTDSNTRVEFAMMDSETIKLNCKNCAKIREYHVDELYAKPSKTAQLIAGLIFLFGTPLMIFAINPIFNGTSNHYIVYIVGGFLLVPIFAYAVINKQDQTRVSDFNRRKLKGRVHNIS